MSAALPVPALAALVFALLYNISFLAGPAVSTGRIAVAALLVLYARRVARAWRDAFETHALFIVALGCVALYSAAQYILVSGGDTTQLSRVLNFCVFVLLAPVLFFVASGGSFERFCTAVVLAVTAQAAVVMFSFMSPPYREWLGTVLVQTGNIPFTAPLQAPGFTNSSGAFLSLIQSLGVFASLAGARMATSRRARIAYLVSAGLCLLSTICTGRTGFQLALLFVVAFTVAGGPEQVVRRTVGVAALGLGLWLASDRILAVLSERNPATAATLEWAFELMQRGTGSASVRELAGQPVPPLSLETMVGTGRVAGPDGGNASGSDSGYVQTYYALGLPLALVFYLALAGFLATELLRQARQRALLAVLVVAMFLVELKEPFIFKYALPFVVTALLLHARGLTQETVAAEAIPT